MYAAQRLSSRLRHQLNTGYFPISRPSSSIPGWLRETIRKMPNMKNSCSKLFYMSNLDIIIEALLLCQLICSKSGLALARRTVPSAGLLASCPLTSTTKGRRRPNGVNYRRSSPRVSSNQRLKWTGPKLHKARCRS
jgi:hypothetical protein